MEYYCTQFGKGQVSMDDLRYADEQGVADETLREIGVEKVGHRLRICAELSRQKQVGRWGREVIAEWNIAEDPVKEQPSRDGPGQGYLADL